ncbi:Essential protein Yae1, N terminal [Teratosphaeria destructans]|uniref:Protein YAE1 n=1 Tax=Teratosphaeria destructans TaxID=418781 RepID=A0A9W7SMJ9_9PEZI|nr:Essential protein Yae1, N terminal [Teratosphaeria destructans]
MLRDLPHPYRDALFIDGALGQQSGIEGDGLERPADTYDDPLDDVFGSAPNSPFLGGDDRPAQDATWRPNAQGPSDINRLRSTHVTNGYREGIAVSKERHMQDGFDEGYNLGAEIGLKAGWCLGALDGIWRALPPAETSGSAFKHSPTGSDVRKMLVEAEDELKIEFLFGKDYFGDDGIWLYHVPGAEDESKATTFDKIADAHPMVYKWCAVVADLAKKLDLELNLTGI